MRRAIITLLLATGMVCLLQGCSVAYDMQQDAAIDACKKIVDWNQRTECLNKNKTSFEEYEKQRHEVINKKTEK